MGTFLSESDISVEGEKGKGAETCAAQSKHTNDGNGNTNDTDCVLK